MFELVQRSIQSLCRGGMVAHRRHCISIIESYRKESINSFHYLLVKTDCACVVEKIRKDAGDARFMKKFSMRMILFAFDIFSQY
jgi:hypothetical protein